MMNSGNPRRTGIKGWTAKAGVAGAAALTAWPVAAANGTGGYHHGMMWQGGPGWFLGPIMMLIFLVVAAAVVALVIRWLSGTGAGTGPHAGGGGTSARAILEQRFARGEIDEEEFRQRKQALEE